ncbi:substrate-binding domain-containing protein [Roseibium sp. CAU 1637]|uniref:Substrate-binding domain-containing protein n=1 Tax=Roseibium limicola TaxID=2816037 RepID=A0A939EMP4_9HYPH|nr:substrate-binding domain-containing protein [Roseibium limicola]MBO0344656.1 substrate-binding domain-containing protein [Roseibium limicola]
MNFFNRLLTAATLGAGLATAGIAVPQSLAADQFIVVQSTTSTQNSGLLDAILPQFSETSGIEVRVVAVGTGQALKNAANGDGDVLLVHAKPAEEKFIADGNGVERFDVMYNDFVIVGPEADPAGIKGMNDAKAALTKIAESKASFASRGDDSGTHKKEKALWQMAGITPTDASGSWYRETGSGMGATLNVAAGMDAYTITDRATWLAFENKANLKVLTEGDDNLFNQYGVILVNPEKHPNVKTEAGQAFIDWLTGENGQKAIAAYKVGGEQLFFPNAQSSASN